MGDHRIEGSVERWVWLLCWGGAAVLALGLTTPWEWLPGGLPPLEPNAGLPPETLDRIEDYRSKAVPVGLASVMVSLAVTVLLGLTPLGARLVRSLPGRRHRAVHRCAAVALVLAIGVMATLPLRAWGEQLARDAGLSTQTWGSWAIDTLTSYAVGVALTSLVLLTLAGLAARVRRWWLVASLAAGALVLVASLVYPIVIEPLYASFTPMEAGPLRTSLLELAAVDGIDVDEVLVADASQRTTAVNAYVSGFGPTRRIVVYDTLLRTSPEQVRLIVAHELGHAANDDVLRGTVIGAAGAVAGLTGLTLLAGSALLRRLSGLDSSAVSALTCDGGEDDPTRHSVVAVAGVPLLLAIYGLGSFVTLPAVNAVSRAVEARADVHALDLTGNAQGFVDMQRRLATTNLNDPSPPQWRQLWFGTHPSTAQRIALAQGWQVSADGRRFSFSALQGSGSRKSPQE
jgi:STE24 endopeptidase